MDSFSNTEFWYVDQGIISPEADGSASFRETLHRQEEKWWLPVPRVPPRGLTENSRKQLDHLRESTNQILKAAMAINSIALGEMEVPESYLETLPKVRTSNIAHNLYKQHFIRLPKLVPMESEFIFINLLLEWESISWGIYLQVYYIGSVLR